jgi:acylphosphatase
MDATMKTYHEMSSVELKKELKKLGIKQYYTMKRKQMIEILSMKTLPQEFVIEKMTIHELRDEAKRRGLRGFWQLRRDALVQLLYNGNVHKAASHEDEKNQGHANKHNAPEQHGTEDIRIENLENGFDNIKLNV